jgi:hypothetical protein
LAVQGRQPLTGARPSYDHGPLQRVQVERVEGLAELQHHVVRDIDREGDRPHAGEQQPPPQPRR